MRTKSLAILGSILLTCVASLSYSTVPVIDLASIGYLVNQLKELKNQSETLITQIKSLNPENYHWSNPTEAINQMEALLKNIDGLSYASKNLSKKFDEIYPSVQSIPDYNAFYEKMAKTTKETYQAILQSIQLSASKISEEIKKSEIIEKNIENAKGITETLQASSHISKEIVSQIQMLRQNMITQINAEVLFYQNQMHELTVSKKQISEIIQRGNRGIFKYGDSGHSIDIEQS